MSHYISSTEIIELEDYEVAGLLAAFEPESDDTDPYIVFHPETASFSVSARWGDAWAIGTTIVGALGTVRGGAIMANRTLPLSGEYDPGETLVWFFGVRVPQELFAEPTLKEVLEQAAAESWKVLEVSLDPDEPSPDLFDALDSLTELRRAALDYLRSEENTNLGGK